MEGFFKVAVRFHKARDEAGYHGVTSTYGVYELAFRCRALEGLAFCRQQDGTVTGHGNQHVLCAFFLQLLGIGDDFFVRGEFHAEHIAEFVIVGLNEERMILQDV